MTSQREAGIIPPDVGREERSQGGEGIQFLRFLPPTTIYTPNLLAEYGINVDNLARREERIDQKIGPRIVTEADPSAPHVAVDLGTQLAERVGETVDIVVVCSSHLPPQDVDNINAQRLASHVRNSLAEKGLANGLEGATPENTRTIATACASVGVAYDMLRQINPQGQRVLLIADETMYRRNLPKTAEEDAKMGSIRLIFSDAAIATEFVYGEDLEVLGSDVIYEDDPTGILQMNTPEVNTDDPFLLAHRPPYGRVASMDGPKLIRHFTELLNREHIEAFVRSSGLTPDQLNFFLNHQASIRVVDHNDEKVITGDTYPNIRHRGRGIVKYGNTSSASTLFDLQDGIQNGDIVAGDIGLMNTFGAGFTAAKAIVRIGRSG